MTSTEIKKAFDDGKFDSAVKSVTMVDSMASVNGRVAFALDAVAGSYPDAVDLEVRDEKGSSLGFLCFCRSCGEVDVGSLTDDRYVAYLSDVTLQEYGKPYSFRKDYLVVPECRVADYRARYMKGAPIWGGFLHESSSGAPGAPKCYQSKSAGIAAYPGIEMPTAFHSENAARSTLEPYAFERFLKLYHLLELLFDYSVVQKIKLLGDDLHGIGELMGEYKAGDVARLKAVVSDGCKDIAALGPHLAMVNNHLGCARKVFFDFKKDSNPFEKWADLLDAIAEDRFLKPWKKKKNGDVDRSGYEALIINCAVYFIYRIRCCIAHSKIGEYVFKNADEEFVVEFGEPLLREVLRQCFSSPAAAVPAKVAAPAPAPPAPAPAAPPAPALGIPAAAVPAAVALGIGGPAPAPGGGAGVGVGGGAGGP